MKATTVPGRTRPNPRTDAPTDLHGDVDINGDLVDALTWQLGTPSMRAMARDRRLADAICGETAELERQQFEAVKSVLARVPA